MKYTPPFRLGIATVVASALTACGTEPENLFPPDEPVSNEAGGGPTASKAARDWSAAADAARSGGVDAAFQPDGVEPVPSTSDAAPPPTPPAPTEDAALPPPAPDASTEPPARACVPPSNGICCGTVPCVGKKCARRCAACDRCAGAVCCVAPNGKSESCVASAAACSHDHGRDDD